MKKISIFIVALMIVITSINIAWAGTTSLNLNPDTIDIGSDFNGAVLNITGNVPEGSDVYIKIASPYDSVLELDKKGKVGFFWMNVETTIVRNVPKMYQILSSCPLKQLSPEMMNDFGLSPDMSSTYSKAEAIKHTDSGSVTLSGEDADGYFQALAGIYKKSHLYYVGENAVKISEGKYEAAIKLPPNIPHEKCSVTVYAVKDGKLISTVNSPFIVNGVGMVKWLSSEAIYKGPEYGFLAVMIALIFGTGIAFMFSYIENILSGGKKKGFNAGGGH